VKIYCNCLVLGLSAVLLALPVLAADKPGKDETRRLQQQLRKAEQDKTQLAQQKAEAENQLKDSQAKAAEAEGRAAAAGSRSARLKKEIELVKAEKEALAIASQEEHATLAGKLAEAERKLAEQRLEKQTLEAAFARQKTALFTCAERNATLHKLGNEVLDKYEQKGCLSSVLEAEPFTQLQRAKLESLIEDYRDKFDNNRLGR
jgi:chromosome segregation ATPase